MRLGLISAYQPVIRPRFGLQNQRREDTVRDDLEQALKAKGLDGDWDASMEIKVMPVGRQLEIDVWVRRKNMDRARQVLKEIAGPPPDAKQPDRFTYQGVTVVVRPNGTPEETNPPAWIG